MDKYSQLKICLAIGIILLFIGVTIVPTINFNTVKASVDDDLVEVTTQTCGIKGYGNTTVKLTRQQHHNLKEYFLEFRTRLNQTTTKEEAVPIFMEAVVELNKYGVLPQGMSVEQAKRLVTGWYQKPIEKVLNNRHQKIFPHLVNAFCLLYLDVTRPLYPDIPFVIVYCPLVLILLPLVWIFGIFSGIVGYLYDMTQNTPVKLLNSININAITDFYSFGLKFLVMKTHSYTPISLVGYTGLMLRPSDDKAYFIGFALIVTSP